MFIVLFLHHIKWLKPTNILTFLSLSLLSFEVFEHREQIDNVYRHARICVRVVFAIRASSSLHVRLYFKRVDDNNTRFHTSVSMCANQHKKKRYGDGQTRRSKSNQTVFSSWFMKMSTKDRHASNRNPLCSVINAWSTVHFVVDVDSCHQFSSTLPTHETHCVRFVCFLVVIVSLNWLICWKRIFVSPPRVWTLS